MATELSDIVALARHSSRLWEPSNIDLLPDCWVVLGVLWHPNMVARVYDLGMLGNATKLSERTLRQVLAHLQRAHMVRPGPRHISGSTVATPGHFVNWLCFHLGECAIALRNTQTISVSTQAPDLQCTVCTATFELLDHPRLQTPTGTLQCTRCNGSVEPPERRNAAVAQQAALADASPSLDQLWNEARACVERRARLEDEGRPPTSAPAVEVAVLPVAASVASSNTVGGCAGAPASAHLEDVLIDMGDV